MKKYYLVYYTLTMCLEMEDMEGNTWPEYSYTNYIETFEFDKNKSFLDCYKAMGNDLRVKHDCEENDEITINDIKMMT